MTRFSGADAVRHLHAFMGDQRGSSSIEYGLIAVAIAGGIAVTYFSVAGEVSALFEGVADDVKGPAAE